MSNSFETSWTVAHQAPLSMGFPRQEYLSGLPFPFPGDLPDPRTEPRSPALQADSLPLSHLGSLFTYLGCAGLPCCTGFSLVAVSGGYSLVAVRGLLIVVASLVVEQGL